MSDHAPVWVVDRNDPLLAEGKDLAKRLLDIAHQLNAQVGEKQLSAALSVAWQMVVQQDPDRFQLNDLLNGLTRTTGWALHRLVPLARVGALLSMQDQILVMAEDSATAAAFGDVPPQGQA